MTSHARTTRTHRRWDLAGTASVLLCLALTGCAASRAPQLHIDRGSLTLQGDARVEGGLVIGRDAAVRLDGTLNQGTYAFPIQNQGLLAFRGAVPQRLTGALAGQGVLHIAAPAEVTLAGENGFDGRIQIERGARLHVLGALGCGRFGGTIVNDGVLIFSLAVQQVLAGTLAGSGELRLDGGTLVLGEDPGTPPRNACTVRATGRTPHLKRYPDNWRD